MRSTSVELGAGCGLPVTRCLLDDVGDGIGTGVDVVVQLDGCTPSSPRVGSVAAELALLVSAVFVENGPVGHLDQASRVDR